MTHECGVPKLIEISKDVFILVNNKKKIMVNKFLGRQRNLSAIKKS